MPMNVGFMPDHNPELSTDTYVPDYGINNPRNSQNELNIPFDQWWVKNEKILNR